MAEEGTAASTSFKTRQFGKTLGEVVSSDPKSRPPHSLRDKLPLLVHGSLPKYSGPYSVGTMEIEVPAEHPQTFSHISRHGFPVFRLETVLLNIFYPSALGSGAGNDPSGGKRWSRETWLPRPRLATATGYGKFAGIGAAAVPFFAFTSMFTKLPAFRNAPLATHWSPEDNLPKSGPEVKNRKGEPPEGETGMPCFPLLIFSHGLGGNRGMYSSMCGEFASYGFVVVAVEHRDGSGPCTFINHPQHGPAAMTKLEADAHILHRDRERRAGYDRIDYLFPKDNPKDTDPQNERGPDKELRAAQIELRAAEIAEAYRVISIIASGEGERISNENLRKKPYVGASSKGLLGVDWSSWKDRVQLESVTMVGHSFGAATTVHVLRKHEQFTWVSAGIIYDIWAAGIPKPEQDSTEQIRVPIIAINSEAFSYWKSNFTLVQSLIDEALANGAPSWLLTVRGSIHVNQSDFSLLYPHLCSYLMKMTVNPLRAVDLNIDASLEFLTLVGLPSRHAKVIRALQSESILDMPAVDVEHLSQDEFGQHRPDQRWIAAKLRIPHEFTYRFGPHALAKRHRARRALRQGELTGKSPDADEIWMHCKPGEDLISSYIARTEGAKAA